MDDPEVTITIKVSSLFEIIHCLDNERERLLLAAIEQSANGQKAAAMELERKAMRNRKLAQGIAKAGYGHGKE